VDATLPTAEFRTLDEIVDRAVSPRRFVVMLLGGFAMLALVLASLGIYGVVSYSVNQRSQEIGIRMALGASAAQVQLAVLRKTVALAMAGALLGTVGSIAVARLLESLLFGVRPGDAATFGGMLVVLTAGVARGYPPRFPESTRWPRSARNNGEKGSPQSDALPQPRGSRGASGSALAEKAEPPPPFARSIVRRKLCGWPIY
jgi:hypothetical protein